MSDIFISYAYGDEEASDQCADALRRLGYSVERPSGMPGGDHGGSWLAREIDRASCVLVLWSRHSVRCSQVLDDAERALIDRKYIPAVISPLMLSEHPSALPLTAAPVLTDWAGASSHPQWRKILRAIESRCPHKTFVG